VTRTILIAGAGYVGGALAAELTARGDRALGLRRRPERLPPGVVGIAADLTDRGSLRDALAGVDALDAVVYAASPQVTDRSQAEAAYRRCYLDGPAGLVAALGPRMPQRFVLVSSTGIYGQDDGAWVDEETPPAPRTATGRVLEEAEGRLFELAPDAQVIRLSGIYGPTRTRLVRSVRDGTARRPKRTRYTNRIHLEDCAGTIVHLLDRPPTRRLFCGVDDDPAPYAEVLAFLAERLGVPLPPEAEGAAPGRGGNKRVRATALKAEGYRFRVPSYREGYPALVDEVLAG
jgi:nucleoside-diphosphate-sugar epimerase